MQGLTLQKNTIWNLDMLTSPYNDTEYAYKYNGKGVRVFVIDTGLDVSHKEFGGRAKCGWDPYKTKCVDIYGHGSHVAGTIGSKTFGVAKKVTLIGIKSLDDGGSGNWATVIAGVDYVVGEKLASPKVPMVINMSLGGGYTSLVNKAVKTATNSNITVVVAAGNNYGDSACQSSPASEPSAITVGSTTEYNSVSMFSSGGKCVDIMAPGSYIDSVTSCSNNNYCFFPSTNSGTSMASPLVAGVAALHLQKSKALNPDQVWKAIKSDARTDAVIDFGVYKVPNRLLSASSLLK
jgi:serine protease